MPPLQHPKQARRWTIPAPSGGSAPSSVAHHRGHVGFGHDLAVDFADTAHLANHAANLDDLELEPDLISRLYRASELHVVERHEVDDLALRVPDRSHQQHAAHLRHRFDDENAGHDWMPRKMSLEERLVDGDVLQSHDPLLLLDLQNPIHQQEGIAVWQNLHDVFDCAHSLLLSTGLHHLPHQCHRSAVTRLYRDDPRAHAGTRQRQIADTVHRLVPHELVVPAQRSAQDVAVIQNDGVVQRRPLDQSLRAKRIDFVNEAKSPRSRKLAGERLFRDDKSARLLPDQRMREFDRYVELEL